MSAGAAHPKIPEPDSCLTVSRIRNRDMQLKDHGYLHKNMQRTKKPKNAPKEKTAGANQGSKAAEPQRPAAAEKKPENNEHHHHGIVVGTSLEWSSGGFGGPYGGRGTWLVIMSVESRATSGADQGGTRRVVATLAEADSRGVVARFAR